MYNTTGASQTATRGLAAGAKGTFVIKAQNDGNLTESFKVTGTAGGAGWTVKYYSAPSGGMDLTPYVTGAIGWTIPSLAPGATKEFRVEVTRGASVASGAVSSVLVTLASRADASESDVVKATAQAQQP